MKPINMQTLPTVLCEPLMINPRALPGLFDEAKMQLASSNKPQQRSEDEPGPPLVNVQMYESDGGSMLEISDTNGRAPNSLIAVVALSGVMTRHGYSGWFSSFAGTLDIGRHLKGLNLDESVGSVVLSVNSPGGSVYGTPEFSKLVYDIRLEGKTRIVACVDPMMASAATYVATAAEKVYCIGSGDCGSIGVVSAYTDYSAYLEKAGINTEYFRVPEKKARFTGVEPLDEDMRKSIMDGINDSYEIFVADMARNRGVTEKHVRVKFGQGEMMNAKESVESGLIDGVMSIDEVLADLALFAATNKREYMRKRAAMQLEKATSLSIEI